MEINSGALPNSEREIQLSELRRQYLANRFEEVSERGQKHRIRQIRRSIARLLTGPVEPMK